MKRSNIRLIFSLSAIVITAVLLSMTLPTIASAQEAAPTSVNAVDPSAAKEATTTLWGLFKLGGWSMYVLLIGSVCAVGLTTYNGMNLRAQKFLRPDVYDEILTKIEALDFEGVRVYTETEKSPVSNIVHAGLNRVVGSDFDIESVEKGMEEAATGEVVGNMVPVNYLSVIAVIAPMVGLLGTVSGMIKAFGNMASAGMGRPEVLADNISEALITTASGLIVGIPVMILYFYFKNRYTGLIAALHLMSGEILEKMKQAARRASYHVTYHGVEAAPVEGVQQGGVHPDQHYGEGQTQ